MFLKNCLERQNWVAQHCFKRSLIMVDSQPECLSRFSYMFTMSESPAGCSWPAAINTPFFHVNIRWISQYRSAPQAIVLNSRLHLLFIYFSVLSFSKREHNALHWLKNKQRCADVGYSLHKSFIWRADFPRLCWLWALLKDFTGKVLLIFPHS